MSRSSFPRPEHAALLFESLSEKLRAYPLPLEVASRGLDHYRCCYRFGLRRAGEAEWKELAIHFQVAERLQSGAGDDGMIQALELFLERHFQQEHPADASG